MDDIYFMKQALDEAKKAEGRSEVPIGAIIVCGSSIIARAHNLTEALNDPTAHAEMQAITMATDNLGGKYLKDCTIYVTIEPCPMCAAALAWAQITKVVYGAKDIKRGASLFIPSLYHPKTEIISGVMELETANLVQTFFKNKR